MPLLASSFLFSGYEYGISNDEAMVEHEARIRIEVKVSIYLRPSTLILTDANWKMVIRFSPSLVLTHIFKAFTLAIHHRISDRTISRYLKINPSLHHTSLSSKDEEENKLDVELSFTF